MNKIIIGLTVFFGGILFAQNKELTMKEAVMGIRPESKTYQWFPGSDQFYEKVKTGYGNALVLYDAANSKTDTLLRSTDFTAMTNVPNLNWIDSEKAYFIDGKTYNWFNKSKKSTTKWFDLPENVETTEMDGKSGQLAYVIDNNLFLIDVNGKTTHLTTDGKYGTVNGKTVHREEFGIYKGIFFSPNGNLMAFYRMDETMVEDYPIVDWSAVPAVNKNIKYPFAGRTIHQVTIGVYNPKTKQTTFLQTGEPKDQYLTCVTWSPDEKSIFVAVLNRGQNLMKLNQYDAQSGKFIRTLFEETDS